MSSKYKQNRYRFTGLTKAGESYELVNINVEENVATYRKANGNYGYLALDEIGLSVSEQSK